MLFGMIFLLYSYSRRSLKIFDWYRLFDTFTKTWFGGLSCVVSSLPAIVVDGSKSFSFPGCSLVQIVSSSKPGCVSLVHGFTHDKSVPLLVFGTSSKLSTANWNSYPLVEKTRPSKWHQRRVVFSRPYVDIFSTNVEELQFWRSCACANKIPKQQYLWTWARASYRTMLPEISARRSLLEPSFRYLSPGKKGEKCRPLDHMWQNPFVHSAR